MSWKASSWAKEQRLGSPAAKAILLCLADSAAAKTGETGWISQQDVAHDSECSARTVWEWLARMERWGLISRVRRSRKNGARAPDGFKLHTDVNVTDGAERVQREAADNNANDDVEGPSLLANIASRPTEAYSQPATNPTRNGCEPLFIEDSTPPNTPSNLRERAREGKPEESKAIRRGFERAFRAWPTSVTDSRPEAMKAWKALLDTERASAEAEASRYVLISKSMGRKLLCSFATYLVEHRWEGLAPRADAAEPPTAPPVSDPPKPREPTAFQRAHPELFGLHSMGRGGG